MEVRFYWWRKLEYPEKTTDLQQVSLSYKAVPSTPDHWLALKPQLK